MSTASLVAGTWELNGDDAKETLERTGRRQLPVDSFRRLRVADGFSHARSLAFMTSLVLVQGLIEIVGLASALGGTRISEVISNTLADAVPGPRWTGLDRRRRAGPASEPVCRPARPGTQMPTDGGVSHAEVQVGCGARIRSRLGRWHRAGASILGADAAIVVESASGLRAHHDERVRAQARRRDGCRREDRRQRMTRWIRRQDATVGSVMSG